MTKYEKAVALWQKKNIMTDAQLAEALNGRSIAFAYHSGKIENEKVTWHDTREIFEHDGVTAYTGDLRTLFEIRNAKDANEFFLTAFQEKRPLDEIFIRQMQGCLTKNTGLRKLSCIRGRCSCGSLPACLLKHTKLRSSRFKPQAFSVHSS